MKQLYKILFFLLMLSTISNGQVPDSLRYKSLPPADFLTAYQKSEKGMMIDVREFFEYKKSRLKDAINIPTMSNLDIPIDTIDKNHDLFFYCTSGFRSKRVAKYFSGKGFSNVYSLEGGITAWRKEKLPIDRKRFKKK
jgi:rhodanese-related sulfurtransferase